VLTEMEPSKVKLRF